LRQNHGGRNNREDRGEGRSGEGDRERGLRESERERKGFSSFKSKLK
jgi:hypothetical protein